MNRSYLLVVRRLVRARRVWRITQWAGSGRVLSRVEAPDWDEEWVDQTIRFCLRRIARNGGGSFKIEFRVVLRLSYLS